MRTASILGLLSAWLEHWPVGLDGEDFELTLRPLLCSGPPAPPELEALCFGAAVSSCRATRPWVASSAAIARRTRPPSGRRMERASARKRQARNAVRSK